MRQATFEETLGMFMILLDMASKKLPLAPIVSQRLNFSGRVNVES